MMPPGGAANLDRFAKVFLQTCAQVVNEAGDALSYALPAAEKVWKKWKKEKK